MANSRASRSIARSWTAWPNASSAEASSVILGAAPHRSRGIFAIAASTPSEPISPKVCWPKPRRLNPDLQFVQTSMLALGLRSESLAGVAAFYSIIHIPREYVVRALAEVRRVLRPGGLFLFTFHLGSEDSHHDEFFGHRVSLDLALFTTAEMLGYLEAADFVIEEIEERDPYAPEVEYQSRRGYILASRPK
jgi:SAM-dependent methyltransferase